MRIRTSVVVLVTAASLLIGGTAYGVYSWVIKGSGEVHTAANVPPEVVVGEVGGLFPGAVVPIKVQVKNKNPYPVRVTRVEGHNPKMPNGCQDYAVAVVKKSPQELAALVIGPGATRDLKVQVEMKEWAKEACADLGMPFDVTVEVTQAV